MGIGDHGVKNQGEGVDKQIRGKANEVAGAVTGDLSQELKGKVQKNVGKVQEKVGRAEVDAAK